MSITTQSYENSRNVVKEAMEGGERGKERGLKE